VLCCIPAGRTHCRSSRDRSWPVRQRMHDAQRSGKLVTTKFQDLKIIRGDKSSGRFRFRVGNHRTS
jgi:hypothetical protein